ncbi:MAG: hypothetical protein V1784_08810 [bacterium]
MICRIPICIFLLAFLLSGCASRSVLRAPEGGRWSAEEILRLHLDRSVAWESLFAPVKVTIEVNEDHWSAAGSFQYLQGERIGLQFRQPYRSVLGDFFLTPREFVYWPPFSSPQVIDDMNTLDLAKLFPLKVPNWDLRDLIPFPLGGRTGAFQLDTVMTSGDRYVLRGRTEVAHYELVASARRGEILQERVERAGRESLTKTFRHYVVRSGWLVPTEVACETDDGRFRLIWKMEKPILRAIPRGS